MIEYRPILQADLHGVIELSTAAGGTSLAKDPERAWRALSAPGVTTIIAIDAGEIVGYAQMQSDGAIQAHLSSIVVAENRRRQGIGGRLIEEAFSRCGAERVDLTTEDAQAFYRSLAHREWTGFRLFPECTKEEIQRYDDLRAQGLSDGEAMRAFEQDGDGD